MAIRMVPDEDQPKQQAKLPGGPRGGGGGGGSMITALLPLLLGFFRKNPKTAIVLVIAIAAFLYFGGGNLFNSEGGVSQITDLFSTGASFDPAQYDATAIFEPPLTDNVANPLPEAHSLLQYAPNRLNQGSQGSCVGWGSAYAARTILEAQRTGKDPNAIAFSPSYLYNQIGLQGCQGAYIPNAMEVMQKEGLALLRDFPYDDNSCSRQPNASLKQEAQQFKMPGYNRLTKGDAGGVGNEQVDLVAIKQNIAQGAPVVIGMMVGGSFMQNMMGKEVWNPSQQDLNMAGFGGHCMCVIGYDDYKEGGAFQIMNSWGPEWGKNGVAWVPYNVFERFTVEAYGVYPMGNYDKPTGNTLEAAFGLMANNALVPLRAAGNNYFETVTPLNKGTKFKIQVTNSQECYTYVFALDANNASGVLFPYTPKHSPYCGITGTRLFPKDYSMELDETGSRDEMAIVLTKQPLDYNAINIAVNKSTGSYVDRFRKALGAQLKSNVSFTGGKEVRFRASVETDEAVLMVFGLDKR